MKNVRRICCLFDVIRNFSAIGGLLLLTACAANVDQSTQPEPSVIEEQSTSETDATPTTDHDVKTDTSDQANKTSPKKAAAVGAPAMKLLRQARDQAAQGYGELASSTLERAISIEPDNPWLWHRLAVLRMQLKHWAQSVELANRSIALADGNQRLIGGNWLVISLALEGAGDMEGAKRAKKHSDTYLGKEN